MKQITEPFSPIDNGAYLSALEELTLELKRAITAVTTGALSDFEHSLVRQQISCMRLAELTIGHPAAATDPASTLSAFADSLLTNRIKAAVVALDTVLRSYSTLLKHFGETARIFAGVFRTYGDSAGIGFCRQKSQGAWSCEL